MRRTASAMLEAAQRGKLFSSYAKAVDTVQRDFGHWRKGAPREDFVTLIGDLWEVSRRAGREVGPKPTTAQEAGAYLSDNPITDADGISLMVLWRRHARGRRYFSPFKKENGDD